MYVDFSELKGKILTDISRSHDVIIFTTSEGEKYKMYHEQDCCERVTVDDISGDFNDLLNTPILHAEENTNKGDNDADDLTFDESYTWTFYNIATIKGYVQIKWYGTSNGYYSESVDFKKL